MNTTIYYFSGTGNSLAAARKIADILGDTELIPIPVMMQTDGDITAPEGRVGIFCPVYDSGIPVIVNEFLNRLKISNSSYCFAIVTLAGQGGSALKLINSTIRDENGKGLNAGFCVKMPANFPPIMSPPKPEKARSILEKADRELEKIGEVIRENKDQKIRMYLFSSLMMAALYGGFARKVHTYDEKFTVSDTCTSCGTCASVCPVHNITIEDGRPVWHHNCELCCACLNYCPVEAIELHVLRGTEGRGRYHHPEVRVSDMKKQQGN